MVYVSTCTSGGVIEWFPGYIMELKPQLPLFVCLQVISDSTMEPQPSCLSLPSPPPLFLCTPYFTFLAHQGFVLSSWTSFFPQNSSCTPEMRTPY